MKDLASALAHWLAGHAKPSEEAGGGAKKSYTEALSHVIARLLAQELLGLRLAGTKAPTGVPDKSFMSALPSKKLGTVLGEAAVLMSGISERRLPTDAPEL